MDGAIAQIEERLKKLLLERTTQAVDANEITSSVALVGGGLALDSVALLEFVVGVEEEFEIFLDDSELTIEHFESLNALARYVETLLEEKRHGG
jgi:acyl carrier protein